MSSGALRATWAVLLTASCLAARTGAGSADEARAGASAPEAAGVAPGANTAAAPSPAQGVLRQQHDLGRTLAARRRLERTLAALARGPQFALGHEDTTAYGVGWSGEGERSDVKSLCGAHVAVYGWDVFGLEKKAPKNGDGVDFDHMRRLIREAHRRGGINTISWHMDNPVSGGNAWDRTRAVQAILPGRPLHARYVEYLDRVADFLELLVGDEGELIPIVFRPFHEHTGSWFWWGARHTNRADYIALWRFTVDHLRRQRGMSQLLFAFSPGGGEVHKDGDYLYRYPGDDYVDVFGVDHYYGNSASHLVQLAEIVVRVAEAHGKVPALTEVGARDGLNARGIDADWVTKSLVEPLARSPVASRIAYVLAWRNASAEHCFLPYPGHPGADAFKALCDRDAVLLEDDMARLQ